MTTKAKCPACGDEEGSEAKALQLWADDGTSTSARTSLECLWTCNECQASACIGAWLGKPATTIYESDGKGGFKVVDADTMDYDEGSGTLATPLTRLHPDDIEAIARRVVELMKGRKTPELCPKCGKPQKVSREVWDGSRWFECTDCHEGWSTVE